MSLQDDYYDLAEKLKGTPEAKALERVWFAFADLETQDMVRRSELDSTEYLKWYDERTKDLKKEGVLR